MSNYLTDNWPLGSTSTIYMSGKAVYTVRRYNKPGTMASVELFPADAQAIRDVINERTADLEAEVERLRKELIERDSDRRTMCGGEVVSTPWIDLPRPDVDAINAAMTDAYDQFDKAYYQSDTAADLTRNATATIEALRIVLAAVSGAA